jgi:hypothetical protein
MIIIQLLIILVFIRANPNAQVAKLKIIVRMIRRQEKNSLQLKLNSLCGILAQDGRESTNSCETHVNQNGV